MLIDAFQPSKFANVILSVTNVVQHLKLPVGGSTAAANPPLAQGGEYIVVQLETGGTNATCFLETGPGSAPGGVETCNIVASVTSFPVRPGQTYVIRRQPGDTHMSIIGGVAGPTVVYVSSGNGTL